MEERLRDRRECGKFMCVEREYRRLTAAKDSTSNPLGRGTLPVFTQAFPNLISVDPWDQIILCRMFPQHLDVTC